MAETAPQLSSNFTLRGTLRALLLFDVAEEIDLVRLRAILGTSPRKREPSFVHVTPEYVRYAKSSGSRPDSGLPYTSAGESLPAGSVIRLRRSPALNCNWRLKARGRISSQW